MISPFCPDELSPLPLQYRCQKRHPPFDRTPTIPLPGLPTAVCGQPEETEGFPVAKNHDWPPAAGAYPPGGHRPRGRGVRAVAANLRKPDLPAGAAQGDQAPARNQPLPGMRRAVVVRRQQRQQAMGLAGPGQEDPRHRRRACR